MKHDKELNEARLALEAAIMARAPKARIELLEKAAFLIGVVLQEMNSDPRK